MLILNQSHAAGAARGGCDDSVCINTSRPACSTNWHSWSSRLGTLSPRAPCEAQVGVNAQESFRTIPESECPHTTAFQTGGFSQATEPTTVTSTSEATCLIISCDPLRQMMFGRSVMRHGWQTVVCPNPVAIVSHLAACNVELALVDCQLDAAVERNRISIALLTRQPKLLTIVCGQARNQNEEIWARSNGVWVYLPGVPPEADLDEILHNAKHVLRRQNRTH